ncbi:MAG: MarR family transcriptional regulator [Rhizobiaceae bacterium]
MVDISKMPGHLIRRLNQISASIFADHMARADYDFTPVQFAALSTILENPGLDQATLAGLIAYDRATMGGVIDRLEAKQLLTRSISLTDRRARQLYLTDKGRQTLAALEPLVSALQGEILQGLDDGEKEQLLGLLEKATNAGNQLSRAPLQKKRAS